MDDEEGIILYISFILLKLYIYKSPVTFGF